MFSEKNGRSAYFGYAVMVLTNFLLTDLSGFWISPQPIPCTWPLSITHWLLTNPQFPCSVGVPATAVRGTSGKFAIAFRRGRVLLPMSFHCCTEASWRTYSGQWMSGSVCLAEKVSSIAMTLLCCFQISSSPLEGFVSTQLRCLDFSKQDSRSSGLLQNHRYLSVDL